MILRIIAILFVLFVSLAARSQCFTTPGQVCVGDCGPIFYLINDAPGTTYAWTISCGTITNDTLANPHVACFMVAGQCTLQVIIQEPGLEPDTCVEIIEVLHTSLSLTIESVCPDDSIEINGSYYTPGMYTDTIFGGGSNGCDSVLLITVSAFPLDTTIESYQGCTGEGYSVIVNNTTYDESNPTGIEILNGSDGCDSIVLINLQFNSPTFGSENYIGCAGDGYFVIVANVIYNEDNPAGTEILDNILGCDSIVTINLVFNPLRLETVTYNGCAGDGYSVTIDTFLFDETNPVGFVTIVGGGCDSIVIVDLHFDTLIASLTLTGNQLCASPSGLSYSWFLCDSTALPDTSECITVNGIGCMCVVIDNGMCMDTVCQDFQVCEFSCEVIAPGGVCLGDSVLLTALTNASGSALFTWTITLDSFASLIYNGIDTVATAFYTPGCYVIELSILDLGCTTTCTDTICVADKPLADLCCDVVACDTCTFLNITLFGTPPWSIIISNGTENDTVTGITSSQYDYLACPTFNKLTNYTLLSVADNLGYCEGGIINDIVSVYLEQRPAASIEVNGDTLCAQPGAFTYGWYNCSDTSKLGSNQCFVPATSGCYCVTVSTWLTDCIDSACINYGVGSIDPDTPKPDFVFSYDAEHHCIIIRGVSKEVWGDYQVALVDIFGRIIPHVDILYLDKVIRIPLKDQAPSIIFISLSNNSFRKTHGMFIPGE